MTTDEKHTHNYTKIGYIREFGTVGRTNELIHEIESRTIDRIILLRVCSCKASIAFDCGDKAKMRELKSILEGK